MVPELSLGPYLVPRIGSHLMKFPKLRVLVVDDNEHFRRAMCEFLTSQLDIDIVCEASNGGDALRFARERKPALVLLDVAMPDVNGFTVARLIKRDLPDTLILVVSQFKSPAFINEVFAAGASGYLVKDHLSSELIPELQRIAPQYAL